MARGRVRCQKPTFSRFQEPTRTSTGHDKLRRRKQPSTITSPPPPSQETSHYPLSHRIASLLRIFFIQLRKSIAALASAPGASSVAVLRRTYLTSPHLTRRATTIHAQLSPQNTTLPGTSLIEHCDAFAVLATMLLPSALPCDAVRPPLPRSHFSSSASARLFSTPPPSDDDVASHLNSGLHNTCRALQTLLGTQKPATAIIAKPAPLLSPIAFAPRIKVGKKSSKPKAAPPPPRGVHKRRRDVADEGRDDKAPEFSTPKRLRLAPLELPLGIRRADFEGLEEGRWGKREDDSSVVDTGTGTDEAEVEWSAEDDRLLVELVLEKLKLTKDDWNECARKLGKESGSLGMRWRELVGGGNVGLRRGRSSCRMKIDSSWR